MFRKMLNGVHLVLEIQDQAIFYPAELRRIIGHDEHVVSNCIFQHIVRSQKELDSLQVAIDVAIQDGIVATLVIPLGTELLGGWLVGGSVVLGIVITRYACLYSQGLGNAEVEGEIALDAYIR